MTIVALGTDVPKHCDPPQKLTVRQAAQDFVEQQKARISSETSCEFPPLFSPSVGDDTKSKVVEKGKSVRNTHAMATRRVTAQLHRDGLAVHKRAMRIMRERKVFAAQWAGPAIRMTMPRPKAS